MNRETEVLTLVRDLARLMTHIRPSSLVPTNVEQSKNASKWHEAVREIEATAHHLLAKDEEPEEFPADFRSNHPTIPTNDPFRALKSAPTMTTLSAPELAEAVEQLSELPDDSGGES